MAFSSFFSFTSIKIPAPFRGAYLPRLCDVWSVTDIKQKSMKTEGSALPISIALNVILLLALLAMTALSIWQGLEAASAQDARPRGAVVTLQADARIVSAEAPTILLPKGTVLQESTPQGAATLGKIYDRQYLLTIRTEDPNFNKTSPHIKAADWAVPYVFAATAPGAVAPR